ncbi:MAG: hypothetical protein AVDCRST_MAG39-1150, partial [uncultured Sphingomonadaceae bacterium]
ANRHSARCGSPPPRAVRSRNARPLRRDCRGRRAAVNQL